MQTRSIVAGSAVLLAAVACGDDARSPTEPLATSQAEVSAVTALAFWQVSAGNSHACGLTTDYAAYCWGSNAGGALGNNSTGPWECWSPYDGQLPCSTRPVAVVGGLRFRELSAGYQTCGVTTDHRAYCWGAGVRRPVAVVGGLRFRQVSAEGSHTCGVTYPDNRAYCWGSNLSGALGDGTTTDRPRPVAVLGGLRFRRVSTGGSGWTAFTCGVTTTNMAFCWGNNYFGQLGDSTRVARRLRPSRVAGSRRFRQVDAGNSHACAVTTSDRAFCWGDGGGGQLGNGTTAPSFWPKAVAGRLSLRRITVGSGHTCGETIEDRAYCWGFNDYGPLGDGTTTNRLRPVAVAGGLSFNQVSAGGHTCGKTVASVGYCWGDNEFGQVGDGTFFTARLRPTRIADAM